jgi:hypothetical protein
VWAYNIEVTAINHFIGSGPFARALRYWAHYHISPAAAALCDKDDQGRCLARGFKLSELVGGSYVQRAAQRVLCRVTMG